MRISGIACLLACSVLVCVLSPMAMGATDEVSEINRLVQQGNIVQALQRIDAHLVKNPGDVKIRFQKGLLLAGRGSIAEAMAEFSTLIRDHPELPEPYNNLAVLHASRGEYDKARTALETAIRLNPAYAIARENLRDVDAKLLGQANEKSRAPDKSNAGLQAKSEVTKGASASTGPSKVESRKPDAIRPPALPAAKSEAAPVAAAGPKDKPVVDNVAGPATQPQASDATVTATTTSANDAADVLATLKRWAQAWANKDAAAYLAFYAPEFKTPDGESRARWEAERRARIGKPGKIEVIVSEPKVRVSGKNRADVSFQQHYQSDTFSARVNKTIVFTKKDGNWLILEERVPKQVATD